MDIAYCRLEFLPIHPMENNEWGCGCDCGCAFFGPCSLASKEEVPVHPQGPGEATNHHVLLRPGCVSAPSVVSSPWKAQVKTTPLYIPAVLSIPPEPWPSLVVDSEVFLSHVRLANTSASTPWLLVSAIGVVMPEKKQF